MLVDFRGVASLATRLAIAPDEMAELWLSSPAVRDYERGQTTTDAFVKAVLGEFAPQLEAPEFLEEMESWLAGPLVGSKELLHELELASIPHSCLSNTNTLHWQQMQTWGIHRTFCQTFLSHTMEMVKPDQEIFAAVTSRLDLAPQSILFFDDHPTNVAAAKTFGLNAVEVRSPEQCRQELVRVGLLGASI